VADEDGSIGDRLQFGENLVCKDTSRRVDFAVGGREGRRSGLEKGALRRHHVSINVECGIVLNVSLESSPLLLRQSEASLRVVLATADSFLDRFVQTGRRVQGCDVDRIRTIFLFNDLAVDLAQ